MNPKSRINELRKIISEANYNYYELDNPTITDMQYDMYMKELIELEIEHPEFKSSLSPSENVGGNAATYLSKVKHKSKMYSLDNIYNHDELLRYGMFLVSNNINPEEIEFYVDVKLDGISLSTTYIDGKYIQAVTRGNGEIGEDITSNVNTLVANLNKELKTNHSFLQLRGECVVLKNDFIKFNNDLELSGEKTKANTRNLAAGLLRRLPENLITNVDIYYYVYGSYDTTVDNEYGWITHEDMMIELSSIGVKTVPYGKVVKGLEAVWEYYLEIEKIRDSLPYSIDGVVFRINDFTLQSKLGYTNKCPKFARSIKFPAERVNAKIGNIAYQVGKTGIITPVAEFDPPVYCNGVVISRATLHNFNIIKNLGIDVGSIVTIERSGDVIPKIIGVSNDTDKVDTFVMPTNCPSCGNTLYYHNETGSLRCLNNNCTDKVIAQLEYAVSKYCFDLKNIGYSIIKELYLNGAIKDTLDVFNIKVEDLRNIGMSDTRSVEMVNYIKNKAKSIPLDIFISSLNIFQVGTVNAKEIAKRCKNIDNFFNLSFRIIQDIPNIGDITANFIMDFLESEECDICKRKINEYNLCIEDVKTIKNSLSTKLANYNLLFTGTFSTDRSEIEQLAIAHGAKLLSSVNKYLNYLVVGDKPGKNKITKAIMLNIPMISEEEFRKLID